MVYRGHVENGQIVLDTEVELPEGATVAVEFIATPRVDSLHPDLERFTGIIARDTDARTEYHDAMRAKHA
ncbi:MAG: hypothetical protein JNK74_18680 [Candidatus Hydrogenedentes bacterium]|nr:hypothetical protein [Candidatus Hydrogenedentota bacterium]